jgi:hypothetical protein
MASALLNQSPRPSPTSSSPRFPPRRIRWEFGSLATWVFRSPSSCSTFSPIANHS